MIKTAVLIGVLLSLPALAFGDGERGDKSEFIPNIHAKNWNVGGYVDLTKNSGRNSDTVDFATSTTAKYFVIDHLALGVGMLFERGTDEGIVSTAGPTATYFFWNEGPVAAHVGLGIRWALASATVNSVIQSDLGAEYFLTRNVALGPALFMNHYDSSVSSLDRYGLAFNLGVYW